MIYFLLQEVYCCGKVSKFGGDAYDFSLGYFWEGSTLIDIIEVITMVTAVFGLLKLVIDFILASISLVEKIQEKKKKQR